MADTKWNSLGLCAGVGMLDFAVMLGCEHLGIDCRPAALCEWEAYAAGVLLSRMEETSLEPCPIWCGDLRDFDARPFRGVVDVIAAGLPCQPYSVAGKQLGLADRRSYGEDGEGPIPQFLRIVSECRPAVVFCENVPPWILRGYFRPVGEELSRMGYTIESPLFVTAESVGASHKRERVFVLAYSTGSNTQFFDLQRRRQRKTKKAWMESSHMANTNGERRQQDARVAFGNEKANGSKGRNKFEQNSNNKSECNDKGLVDSESVGTFESITGSDCERIPTDSFGTGKDLANASGERLSQRCGNGIAIQSQYTEPFTCLPELFAPGPNANWGDIPAHLYPAIEPGFRFVADGCSLVVDSSRADQLRCAGNAVVPLCASFAFVELMRRAMKEIP